MGLQIQLHHKISLRNTKPGLSRMGSSLDRSLVNYFPFLFDIFFYEVAKLNLECMCVEKEINRLSSNI